MSCTSDRYSDKKMQAFLGGELSRQEAGDIRAHVETCADCRHVLEELVTVRDLLQTDLPVAPLRPMWPGVLERLNASARPRFRLIFAMGTSAAVVAGVVLGLFLGSPGVKPSESASKEMWSDVPTTLMGNRSGGLADSFFGTGTQEGTDAR